MNLRGAGGSYGRPESVPGPGRPYEVELLALADEALGGAVRRIQQGVDGFFDFDGFTRTLYGHTPGKVTCGGSA